MTAVKSKKDRRTVWLVSDNPVGVVPDDSGPHCSKSPLMNFQLRDTVWNFCRDEPSSELSASEITLRDIGLFWAEVKFTYDFNNRIRCINSCKKARRRTAALCKSSIFSGTKRPISGWSTIQPIENEKFKTINRTNNQTNDPYTHQSNQSINGTITWNIPRPKSTLDDFFPTDIRFLSYGEERRAIDRTVAFSRNESQHTGASNRDPQQPRNRTQIAWKRADLTVLPELIHMISGWIPGPVI